MLHHFQGPGRRMQTSMVHLAQAQTGHHFITAPAIRVQYNANQIWHSTNPPQIGSLLSSKKTAQSFGTYGTQRFMSTRSPPCSLPSGTTTLEVERKFAPTPNSIHLLTSKAGQASFNSFVNQGSSEFLDTYYDTPESHLSNAGVWLRCRGDVWEAKVRVGGDYTNSAFEEITCVEDISALLGKVVPGAKLDATRGPQGGDLQQLARFVSYRRKFLADDKFTVVLDSTDFGHVVGEVELERAFTATTVERDPGGAHGHGNRAEAVAEMDREIDEFMKLYLWAFPAGKPVGKLSAFLSLERQTNMARD